MQAPGRTIVLDLDGVVWLAGEPIAGAPEAVGALRAAGWRVVFQTNNAYATTARHAERLQAAGVPCEPGDVLSSALAAASLLEPGQRALLLAGPGAREALERRGVEVVAAEGEPGPVDAVVVGFHPEFDYGRLTLGFQAVLAGARFVATNTDPTYPRPDGLVPGSGSLVAAMAASTGVAPEVAGKPHPPSADLLRSTFGEVAWVVGDRQDTDGGLARAAGARFALVLSGVTAEPDPADVVPDLVTPDLAGFAAALAAAG